MGDSSGSAGLGSLSCLPLEIRRCIYTHLVPAGSPIHIIHRKSGLCLSQCSDPDILDLDMGAMRRESFPPDAKDAVWQRRLLSRWGPHWRCEEKVDTDSTLKGPQGTMLHVSKLLRFEFAQVLAENSRFQMTCLRDLAALDQPRSGEISIASLLRPHMRHVALTFNLLPISLFRELHVSLLLQGSDDGTRPINSQHCATMPLWLSYPEVLASLPELRTLHIRVDHDKPHEWFEHDTDTVIESLYPLMIDKSSNLQRTVFYLPRSPPQLNPPSPGKYTEINKMEIQWIRRQRYRVEQNELGELSVCYQDEWPALEGHPCFYEVGEDGVDIYDGSYWID